MAKGKGKGKNSGSNRRNRSGKAASKAKVAAAAAAKRDAALGEGSSAQAASQNVGEGSGAQQEHDGAGHDQDGVEAPVNNEATGQGNGDEVEATNEAQPEDSGTQGATVVASGASGANAGAATASDPAALSADSPGQGGSTDASEGPATAGEAGKASEPSPEEQEKERQRAEKKSLEAKVAPLLPVIRDAGISPFDIILSLLDEESDTFKKYRTELYKEGNRKISKILDELKKSPKGVKKLQEWLKGDEGHSVLRDTISEEMDALHDDYMLKGVADITPEYIKNQEPDDFQTAVPFTARLLRGAAQTKRQEAENKKKTPDAVCDAMIRILLYQRSNRCSGFQAQFGLYLWATGASRQSIDAVHILGLSISYQSVLNLIAFLAAHCMALAVGVAMLFHAFCYDNINISTSIHVEQKGKSATTGKVTSGTLGIVYPLPNATPEAMELGPLLKQLRRADYNGLSFEADLQLKPQQYADVHHQFLAHIINVLFKYSSDKLDKSNYDDPRLVHKEIRLVAATKARTEFFPIRVSTTEEATVQGNAKYHSESYAELKRSPEELSKYAIPTVNDQLTNSRIRTLQVQRKDDLNDWHRRLAFQVAMGLFHAALSLSWGILHVHRLTLKQKASLAYWIAIMDKARLAGKKPDYHTLYATLVEILEGVLLAAWKEVCTQSDTVLEADKKANASSAQRTAAFERFAASSPTADDIVSKAKTILTDFITPLPTPFTPSEDTDESEEGEGSDSEDDDSEDDPLAAKSTVPPPVTGLNEKDPARDKVHQNLRLLIRDVLYLLELVSATGDGDIGRIELILPHLAMIYRGAGNNNYCIEVLFLIQNLKHIWTPEFADIMRDILIVNPSGIPGHNIATDINMEYTVGDIKELIVAKGCESTWDHIGDISAAIDHFKAIKRKISKILSLPHQNKGHSDVDVSKLVWLVATTVEKEGFLKFKRNRKGNASAKLVKDLVEFGAEKLKSGTLASFNLKFKKFVAGDVELAEEGSALEEDELPPVGLTFSPEDEPEEEDELSDM